MGGEPMDIPLHFLVGERIYLRPLEAEDEQYFYPWFNNYEIMKMVGEVYPLSREKTRNRLEEWISASDSISLTIVIHGEDRIIGTVGLLHVDTIHRRAELGIIIGEEEYWSKGYGTEAIALLLQYGFNRLNLHMVYLGYIEFNEMARKCYENLGFCHDGVIRDKYCVNGTYYNCIMMSILREEWITRNMNSKNNDE